MPQRLAPERCRIKCSEPPHVEEGEIVTERERERERGEGRGERGEGERGLGFPPENFGALTVVALMSQDTATVVDLQKHAWYVLPRKYLLEFNADHPLPVFSHLRKTNAHVKLDRTEVQILTQGLPHTWIISHRWFDIDHPDKECAKLKRPQDLLKDRPDISSVWIDHTCLPQGRRNEQEQHMGPLL